MRLKKLVVTAVTTGGLAAGSLALGAGTAGAHPDPWLPKPPPPGHIGHVVNVPPGHIGQWVGVPPGHWDKPWKWLD